ncbi:MAG: YifB family Mg chelatase-like AAA ATPase [Candidatus Bruticola sp.]
MFANIFTAALIGVNSHLVSCEVDISRGLPRCIVVGLPDASVSEASERIWAAFSNSGYEPPAGRVRINLAPAELRKEGARFDLSMALAVLAADENCSAVTPDMVHRWLVLGELAMNGRVRGVRGVLMSVLMAKRLGFVNVLVPQENLTEASLVEGINCQGVMSLAHAAALVGGQTKEAAAISRKLKTEFSHSVGGPSEVSSGSIEENDLQYVCGQAVAKRGLEICAAGGHHILMLGPPGSGKTMLARCLSSILPRLSREEAIEVAAIHSISQCFGPHMLQQIPFRAPSSNISAAGLLGSIQPGEVTLSHKGILFMDEFTEFRRDCLEALRRPLESGRIEIARAKVHTQYPCRFTLVAAMNPCPCGYWGDREKNCVCQPSKRLRYLSRLSGPLLDRIDLQIQVSRASADELLETSLSENSAQVRTRIERALEVQRRRGCRSAFMNAAQTRRFCHLDKESQKFLAEEVKKRHLSGRVKDRLCRTARTIADLDGRDNIVLSDLCEAMEYRAFDRFVSSLNPG